MDKHLHAKTDNIEVTLNKEDGVLHLELHIPPLSSRVEIYEILSPIIVRLSPEQSRELLRKIPPIVDALEKLHQSQNA